MNTGENIGLTLRQVEIGYERSGALPVVVAGPISTKAGTGEIIGLIGRNGCGKTTLLKTLVRLQLPLKGSILVDGRDIHSFPRIEFARFVGFVSTESVNIQHITLYELVSLGRFPYTNWLGSLSSEDRLAVNRAIDMAGIGHLRLKYLHEMSDGERQKTMIARVLAQDTRIVVLDEPTAFLDLPNRYELLRLLNELAHNSGKTIIYSTHDLNIAMHESDKIWLMTAGKIIEGAPEDLIITKGFHKLFENSDLDFDIDAGFRLKRKGYGTITVSGDESLNTLTYKALERIGMKAEKPATGHGKIVTGYCNGVPCWSLMLYDEAQDFYSLYDLISTLKKHIKLT
jgi:iron complex transport system ATP-binding protein